MYLRPHNSMLTVEKEIWYEPSQHTLLGIEYTENTCFFLVALKQTLQNL